MPILQGPVTESMINPQTTEAGASARPDEAAVLHAIEADFAAFREHGFLFEKSAAHTDLWNSFYTTGNRRLFDEHGNVNRDVIRNFWRSPVFISDNPKVGIPRGPEWLLGERRGEIAVLDQMKKLLRNHGCRELMAKYPCPTAGNPHVYQPGGYRLTHRWAKHLFNIGRMNEFLRPHLSPGFTALDIGAGHGLFSSLVGQEYPGSHNVVVDLPEPLLLARYFLQMTFPSAKIAGMSDLGNPKSISREDLEKYDYVILPWQLYERLEPGSIDLMASFAALGELKREFFSYYVDAPVFQTAKFLHTANPVETDLMFNGSDITVMDYPLARGEGCFRFGISPVFIFPYTYPDRRWFFSYRMKPFTPFFEYLGRIDPADS